MASRARRPRSSPCPRTRTARRRCRGCCDWRPAPRLRGSRPRAGPRRRQSVRIASTARPAATSPALCPPIPSATTNTPPAVSIRNASSLLARGPGWVTPCAITPIPTRIIAAPVLYTPTVATSTVQAALARAASALERGRGAEAVQILLPYHRSGALPRDDELSVRRASPRPTCCQDDLTQAAAALGRPPDVSKEPLPDARLSTSVAPARTPRLRATASSRARSPCTRAPSNSRNWRAIRG